MLPLSLPETDFRARPKRNTEIKVVVLESAFFAPTSFPRRQEGVGGFSIFVHSPRKKKKKERRKKAINVNKQSILSP
jgi:hypothetical protein